MYMPLVDALKWGFLLVLKRIKKKISHNAFYRESPNTEAI